MSQKPHHKVAVIGGGVSGLAAAHYLARQGLKVDLYEASDRLGGRMALASLDGQEICLGGKNIGCQYSEFRKFLDHYGAPHYEYFGLNSARLSKGKVLPFNSRRKRGQVKTLLRSASVSDLRKLLQMMKAVKTDRANGDLSGPYFQALGQKFKTLPDYFSPRFSNSLARALTVRMNGAEPEEIALETFGTHLQMLQDEYDQLSTPLSDIFSTFQQDPNIHTKLETPVRALRKTGAYYAVTGDGFMTLYPKIILALPAYAAAELTTPDFPEISNALRKPRYFPVTVVVAKYEQPVFTGEVRALTFPPDSALSNIGAYGINDLNLVRYTFSGGAAQALQIHDLSDDELISIAEDQAAPYFNLTENSCQAMQRRSWAKGLCGYTRNEVDFQAELPKVLAQQPGLYVTGDYIKGASIENCFRAAKACVDLCIRSPLTDPVTPLPQNFSERAAPCQK